MQRAIDETERRRAKQIAHNAEHGITPQTIVSRIKDLIQEQEERGYGDVPLEDPRPKDKKGKEFGDRKALVAHIEKLRSKMHEAARALDFEAAAQLRDEIFALEKSDLSLR
jgi:excinuclease ABC subunit B